MGSKKYSFGKIITHEAEDSPGQIIRINSLSDIGPKFVNDVDEKLWKDYWDNKSKRICLKYVHGQDRFDKDNRNSYWSSEDVNKFEQEIIDFTQSYNDSAKKYNEKIAEPFIRERKSLIDDLLEK